MPSDGKRNIYTTAIARADPRNSGVGRYISNMKKVIAIAIALLLLAGCKMTIQPPDRYEGDWRSYGHEMFEP